MRNWHIADAGVPIEQACSIIGLVNPAAYMIMRNSGAFGTVGREVAQRASILEICVARSLLEAERSGMIREHARPFIKQIGEASYLYLATVQLSRRSWQSNEVPGNALKSLADRVTSAHGQWDLQMLLKIEGRYDLMRPFAVLSNARMVFESEPPAQGQIARPEPFVDIRTVAQHVENYAGRQLFYGVY